jgi:CRISPR/Cas system type I-B associated protein Csh2 (Cas7 group RAMP superfamily)
LKGNWCSQCGLEVTSETKEKISNKLKEFLQTEEGKENKKISLEKRSQTMKLIKEQKKETITEKSCKKCTILKPIINYCKKTASADGFQSWCKQCTALCKKATNILI